MWSDDGSMTYAGVLLINLVTYKLSSILINKSVVIGDHLEYELLS